MTEHTRLDESRRFYGTVFSALQNARDMVNAAWYEVEDKQALKDEDISRWKAIIKLAQRVIDTWEEIGKPA